MCGLSTTPKPMSQTESQLEIAKKAKTMLFESIGILAERLKPALRQRNPETTEDCAKEQQLTDIAEAIKGLASDFNFASSQIKDLIDRLEI